MNVDPNLVEYTAFYPFCGLGGGAMGFSEAETHLFDKRARFRNLGGIDIDPAACRDFEYLTGSRALCTDITTMTPAALRAFIGHRPPDAVFTSAPCKGSSGLLPDEKAKTPKYEAMNQLALICMRLILETWDTHPRLLLFENVPRIKTRAASMLNELKAMLRKAGYVLHEGFHECGELGGLAQIRRRYLLVARLARAVPNLLRKPVKKRVRACGEVLGQLPMPGDPAAGPMHVLPKISWLNWVRLALIPAGGDWRDLPGVLADGENRRKKFKRHRVEPWTTPTGTVGGSGSNGVGNVADPRVEVAPMGQWFSAALGVNDWSKPAYTVTGRAGVATGYFAVGDPRPVADVGNWHHGVLGVLDWDKPAGTVTGGASTMTGRFAVADARLGFSSSNANRHWNKYKLDSWELPAHTVTGATRPGSGSIGIDDPRVKVWLSNVLHVVPWSEPAKTVTTGNGPTNGGGNVADPRFGSEPFGHVLRVISWDEPARTVTRSPAPSSGAGAVADPRPSTGFDHAYGVLDWSRPSYTIAAGSHPGQGAYSVAEPRWLNCMLNCKPRAGAYGVIPWAEAAKTVTGSARIDNGRFAIADPRAPESPLMVIEDIEKAPPLVPVIISADGTWHRPMTTLELAALQDIPTEVRGEPLKLDGNAVSAWRERIGNAVPRRTACAVAEQMLLTLLGSDAGTFTLCGDDVVWVEPDDGSLELVFQ